MLRCGDVMGRAAAHPSLPVGTLRPDPRQLEGQLALLRELERERSNQGAINGTL